MQEITIDISELRAHLTKSKHDVRSDSPLEEDEKDILEKLTREYVEPDINAAFKMMVVVVKTTRLCNLRCVYCNQWRSGPGQVTGFEVMAKLIRDVQWSMQVHEVSYAWHGGEPTLLPLKFYEKFVWLTEYFKIGRQKINFSIQTNGTLLSDAWIKFFLKNKVEVGVSLDGPSEINDVKRLDKKGRPTTEKVLAAIKKLNAAGAKYGLLVVVDTDVFKLGPKRLLDFFVRHGIKAIGILNQIPENVEEAHSSIEKSFIPWDKYIQFLALTFREWWEHYREKIQIREIQDLLAPFLTNSAPMMCYYKGNCLGKYITLNPNGDIDACDKFVDLKNFSFGNILESDNLISLIKGSNHFEVAWNEIEGTVGKEMKQCKWFDRICKGGCSHDRRLNQLLNGGKTRQCCGLAPLLNEFERVTQGNNNEN